MVIYNKMAVAAVMATFSVTMSAQALHGYVKTLGRPNKPGQPLSGVTVRTLEAHNAALTSKNGTFEMPMTGKSQGDPYTIQSVQKKGYQLNDVGMVGRKYAFSNVVKLNIVMVENDRFEEDKMKIENNAYIVAERNYKNKVAELDKLKSQNAITIENYQKRIQDLQKKFEKFQGLINDLADHYARTDYDELDERSKVINQYIESGELEKADSMIQTMFDPAEMLKRNKEAMALVEGRLSQASQMLDKANLEKEAVLKRQAKDAEYLYQLYTISLARFDNDKAAYYIGLRAELDTANVDWQIVAADFMSDYAIDYDKAISIYNRALRNAVSQNGDEHSLVSKTLNKIGTVYYYLNDYDNALSYYDRALKIRLDSISDNEHQVSNSYNYIGNVYFSQGKYENALDNYLKSAEYRIKKFGENSPEAAETYSNIGNVYSRVGNTQKAIEYLNKALDIQKQTVGEFHPNVAALYSSISGVYSAGKDYDNALMFQQKAVDVCKKALGESNSDVAVAYSNMGSLYYEMGDYDNADKAFDTATEIMSRVMGERHPMVAALYSNIANSCSHRGQLDKALEFSNKALDIQREKFGDEHLDVAFTYNNLGEIYYAKDNYDKAVECYNSALKIFTAVSGENSVNVSTCYYNIGKVYYSQQKDDSAISYFSKSLEVDENVYGKSHPNVATAYYNMAIVYKSMGKNAEAKAYFEKALDIYKASLGEDSEYTQQTIKSLNELKAAMGVQ